MSIALGMQRALRSFRSLMCFDAARVFLLRTKKRHLLTMEIARDRPSRYGEKTVRVTVGRGPSHATRACERVCATVKKTDITGDTPRTTVKKDWHYAASIRTAQNFNSGCFDTGSAAEVVT